MSNYPYAANLTPEKVKDYARSIGEIGSGDPEAAHSMEDNLRMEVLTAIATSTVTGTDALLCALYAIGTKDFDFPRWYA